MVKMNAKLMLDELRLAKLKREFVVPSVDALKRDLRLNRLPRRIECFDLLEEYEFIPALFCMSSCISLADNPEDFSTTSDGNDADVSIISVFNVFFSGRDADTLSPSTLSLDTAERETIDVLPRLPGSDEVIVLVCEDAGGTLLV